MAQFLLEVGTEELPADFVASAIAQWQEKIPQTLAVQLLTPETVEVYGTPRRLAVILGGLAEQQGDRTEEIKGPPATAAFQAGKATPALEGFLRKQGVTPEAIEIRQTDKGEFVFVQKKIPGRPCTEILQELIPQWLGGLEGRRFMRWGDGDLRFPRPLRWLVALWDEDILPLEITNGSSALRSDRFSRGHRTLHPQPVPLPHAAAYLESLRQAYIEADPRHRQQIIVQQIQALATSLQGQAEIPPSLLAEVTNLVEYPTACAGKFEEEFLDLPPEVIKTVMVTHQRYFPVSGPEGLLPYFMTISNGDPARSDLIALGNERVIRARLADAKFFYQADCDEPLASYLPLLENVTFQEELGTMHDKVDRIMEIANTIAEQLDLEEGQKAEIESTAMLCKADLVTQMVYEFPELQGIMGQKYALVSGESPHVAQGIFEHYLPRHAEDQMPTSLTGQVVGLSDRLDTLVSIFGLGMLPSGSSDPFALRRSANAIINITWFAEFPLDLAQLLEQVCTDFVTAHPDKPSPLEAVQQFFMQRLDALLQDELHLDYDLVRAVLGEDDAEYTQRALENLLDLRERALFLQSIRHDRQLDAIYDTVNRSTRLASKGTLDTQSLDPQPIINTTLLAKSSERNFYEVLLALVPTTQAAQSERNYQKLVDGLAEIAPIVSEFFDGENSVLVMADDLEIRANRLNLLGLLRNHARVLADFGAIVK